MPRARQKGQPIGSRLLQYGLQANQGVTVPNRGDEWFVDTYNGSTGGAATSWSTATNTMAQALAKAQTHDTIYFVGDIREEITGSNLKFDIKIVGCGGKHHPDQPGTAPTLYDPAAACWRPPSSPTAATPLIKVRGRGWQFHNIMFDCPVDEAAIYLERNASSGTSEYDPSHAVIQNCRFVSGKFGIKDVAGTYRVTVRGCDFFALSESGGCAIITTGTGVAVPLNWLVEDNHFAQNVSHMRVSLNYGIIRNNSFGNFTTTGIKTTEVSAQGSYNMIYGNALSGTYSNAGGYTGAATDEWGGNYNSLSGGVTAADPA